MIADPAELLSALNLDPARLDRTHGAAHCEVDAATARRLRSAAAQAAIPVKVTGK